MEKEKYIYLVNTVEDFEKDDIYYPDEVYSAKGVRTPAYFFDLKNAKDCIEGNIGDIYETIYNYACIEKIKSGLYPLVSSKIWYKWDDQKKKYIQIKLDELPFTLSRTVQTFSFAIG